MGMTVLQKPIYYIESSTGESAVLRILFLISNQLWMGILSRKTGGYMRIPMLITLLVV
jgi:hypothetical protein